MSRKFFDNNKDNDLEAQEARLDFISRMERKLQHKEAMYGSDFEFDRA
jgi:hypothetical protein